VAIRLKGEMMEVNQQKLSVDSAGTVDEALLTRRSVRAFLNKEVERQQIEDVLRLASHAPSGSNFQPWHVYVATGETLARLTHAMQGAYLSNNGDVMREYDFYMNPIEEPYLSRRRACGWGLYATLGIERHEKDRLAAQRARNFVFFDAPVGMIFTIDRRMASGSYIDYGMFLQSIALAARARGLHTCAQASIAEVPQIVCEHLNVPPDEMVLCGMALGYADPDAVVNEFSPKRQDVEAFTRFFN
jgi:nitroreductase